MPFGPCLCGDIHCGSCGPAQGFSKCPACGEWSDEHGEDGSKHGEECEEHNRLAAEAEAAFELEMEKAGAEYERLRDEGYFNQERA